MTLTALRDDALSSTADGFALRLGLPWIRSLPLASLRDLSVSIDGEAIDPLTVELDGRLVDPGALADEAGLVVPAGPPHGARRTRTQPRPT